MRNVLLASLFIAVLLAGSTALGEPPADELAATPGFDVHCGDVAATQTGFDPRTTPRPVPREAAPTSAAATMPPVGVGAHSPPPPVVQQSSFVAQEQARWDAENAKFRRAYEACMAAPPKADE